MYVDSPINKVSSFSNTSQNLALDGIVKESLQYYAQTKLKGQNNPTKIELYKMRLLSTRIKKRHCYADDSLNIKVALFWSICILCGMYTSLKIMFEVSPHLHISILACCAY